MQENAKHPGKFPRIKFIMLIYMIKTEILLKNVKKSPQIEKKPAKKTWNSKNTSEKNLVFNKMF